MVDSCLFSKIHQLCVANIVSMVLFAVVVTWSGLFAAVVDCLISCLLVCMFSVCVVLWKVVALS